MTTFNPESISTKGFTKAQVLSALWNTAKPDRQTMSPEEAEQEIHRQTGIFFDTIRGKPLKVELNGEILDPTLYDQQYGQGTAKKALETLRTEPRRMAG